MKKIYLLLIFLIPLFIAGCAGSRSLIGSGSPNGIQIKFLQPSFPADAVKDEDDQITVLLDVTNYAECDAMGKICVDDGGLSDAFGGFNKNRDCQQLDIPGPKEEKGRLSYNSEKFIFTSQPYQNLFTDTSVSINAIANYKCEVAMSTNVCVKSPANEISECKLLETISGNNLGAKAAPVTLTQIRKTISVRESGLRLNTELTLKKMNKGFVIDENDNTQLFMEVNYGGSPMDCSKDIDYKDGVVMWKPSESEKNINCEILLSNVEETNPLTVHLVYDYEISEETQQIRIRAEREVA